MKAQQNIHRSDTPPFAYSEKDALANPKLKLANKIGLGKSPLGKVETKPEKVFVKVITTKENVRKIVRARVKKSASNASSRTTSVAARVFVKSQSPKRKAASKK
ncbi:MAG: hypothetical protein ABIO79_05755 [Ferruginibacter sp.]